MYRLWDSLIEPLLTRLEPKLIVEIGAGAGANTKNLLIFCRTHGSVLHAIDPAPAFDVPALEAAFAENFTFHRARSLDALPEIGPADAVLIDGDHNWFTVFHELLTIERLARDGERPFPLVLLHDVGWPYGRRDLYYEPAAIPELFRKPFEQRGIAPGSARLVSPGGLNEELNNAVSELGSHNGVLTAVEDFLGVTAERLAYLGVPGFHGLGILAPSVRTTSNRELRAFLGKVRSALVLDRHVTALEEARIAGLIAIKDRERREKEAAARAHHEATLESAQRETDVEAKPRTLVERDAELRSELDQSSMAAEAADGGGKGATADIVICVHDALDDVRSCLASIVRNTSFPHRLILVDDASGRACREFLATFARSYPEATLVRHEQRVGYTRAANQGLRLSRAEFVVLLNSDTVVTPGWLDRLVECASSDNRIGVVGPLSNAASWQSVPELFEDGDWSPNPLPAGCRPDDVAEAVARVSRRAFPRVPFVNGFCFLMTRRAIETVGYFDDDRFEAYGEENDFCVRAADAGFELAIADHAYVYHAKSRSYSHEQRRMLVPGSVAALEEKYGRDRVEERLKELRDDPTLAELRRAVGDYLERWSPSPDDGERNTPSVLFLLPVQGGGGGEHSVVQEAAEMRRLGVRAEIAVPAEYAGVFRRNYPGLSRTDGLFYVYGRADELTAYASRFRSVVATVFYSVRLLKRIVDAHPSVTPGYYIQDYEPWFFGPGTKNWREAVESYTLVPGAKLFAKTEWLREQVQREHGVPVHKVVPSIDHSIYFPPAGLRDAADPVVRVAAMVRPSTPRRAGERTMRVLRRLRDEFGPRVSVHIFGCDVDELAEHDLERGFDFTNEGVLIREQVAELLRGCDVFVDLSDYQAFGRAGLEAMACGCAVVLPANGGAAEYAVDHVNAVLVETTDEDACYRAVSDLVIDGELRTKLQAAAIAKAAEYPLRRAALSELAVLAGREPRPAPERAEEAAAAAQDNGQRPAPEPVETAVDEQENVDGDLLRTEDKLRRAFDELGQELRSAVLETGEELRRANDATKAALDALAADFRYSRSIDQIREVVRTKLPPKAVVAVVSKGDLELVNLDGRRGWHFPQNEDGVYAGHYPDDDKAAIEHLETLRARGAEFLVFPSAAHWWLDYYAGFAHHLEANYKRVWRDDNCVIFEIARRRGDGEASRGLIPRLRRRRVDAGSGTTVAGGPVTPARGQTYVRYEQVVERVRAIAEDAIPEDATVLVVSKGDDELLRLGRRRAWHFPRAENGLYAGYHPATSEAAIEHLEALRERGAGYLVLPSTAYWWLDHYADFRRYLDRRCTRIAADEFCAVYKLEERHALRRLFRRNAEPEPVQAPLFFQPTSLYAPVRDLRFVLDYPETLPLSPPGDRFDPQRMRLNWIVPDFSPGMGGPMAIFRFINLLENFGHENTVWIRESSRSAEDARRLIHDHFVPLSGDVHVLDGNVDEIEGDAVIATHCWTAYPARAVTRVRERFYFVQDYEPLFYPMGSHYLLAEATYRFGFTCITSGKWLQHVMRSRYHAKAERFEYAYDPDVYHVDDDEPRAENRIAFYARTRTPRRAVELGLLALDLVARQVPSLVVDFFGASLGELDVPYSYTDHGILDDRDLARLYHRATVGAVFSTTNYSLIPKEMMACGLPVLELYSESTAVDFPSDAITLSEPTPQAIADNLVRLLSERALRERQAARALEYVGALSWENSARAIESALRAGVEARGVTSATRSTGANSRRVASRLPASGVRARSGSSRDGFAGPMVFAAQPEYYRSTYYDLVAAGEHFEFPITSADPSLLEGLPEFVDERGAKTCIVYRPEWFTSYRDAFYELKRRGVAVIGYSSEPVPQSWRGRVHPDQLRRLESLKRALKLDYDLIIHYDPCSLELLRGVGFPRIIAHPLPVSRTLFFPEDKPKDFDVCFLGKSTPYRERMLLPLKMRFNTVHVAHGLRDEDARELMNRSRLVLNLHNEDYVNFENRVIQALFCRSTVLSERLSGDLLVPDRDYVLITSPEDLSAKVSDFLNGRQWPFPDIDLSIFTPDALVTRLRSLHESDVADGVGAGI